MHVVPHAHLPHVHRAGDLGIVAVERRRGTDAFEVWIRTLDTGRHTASLRHEGQLAVLALAGAGKLLIDGGPQRFTGPCTLLIPPHTPFEIANHGVAPLQLVWVFTHAPVDA